jgi:hypothetical protein
MSDLVSRSNVVSICISFCNQERRRCRDQPLRAVYSVPQISRFLQCRRVLDLVIFYHACCTRLAQLFSFVPFEGLGRSFELSTSNKDSVISRPHRSCNFLYGWHEHCNKINVQCATGTYVSTTRIFVPINVEDKTESCRKDPCF